MRTKRISLNVDIGEGFPFDRQLLNYATAANVCCGQHAGSWGLTQETIKLVQSRRVMLGVHPGYPDRDGLGRRGMEAGQVRAYLDNIFAQVRRFAADAHPEYLKPHGGFYSDTSPILPADWNHPLPSGEDPEAVGLARYPGVQLLAMLLRIYRLPLLGMPGTAHEALTKRAKQSFIAEGFADRAYSADGRLLPRSEPGAVIHDRAEIKDQVLRLAETVDSICIHGDTEGCVDIAAWVSESLKQAGYLVVC